MQVDYPDGYSKDRFSFSTLKIILRRHIMFEFIYWNWKTFILFDFVENLF